MIRVPVLQILNKSGVDILPRLTGLWVSCKVSESAGQESDTAEIVCVRTATTVLPARGDEFTILGGWLDEGPVNQGRFTVQKITLSGGGQDGDMFSVQLRAADYVDRLKGHATKHYDDTTYGKIVEDIAKQCGLDASVDSDVAKIKVPYALRFEQSHIDFLTHLSDDVGAVCKPAGGTLIAVRRGGGKSASGKDLSPILITRGICLGYDLEIEPRPEVGDVAAAWHDEKTGKRKIAKHKTGRKGPVAHLPHPYRSEDEAKKAAEADAYERGNDSASGDFRCVGLPQAHAEAPVVVSGFGSPIDGRWKAESVEKVWGEEAFITTVSVKAGDDQKGDKR